MPLSDSRLFMLSVRAASTTSTGSPSTSICVTVCPVRNWFTWNATCCVLRPTEAARAGSTLITISSLASLTLLVTFSTPGTLFSSSISWTVTAEMSE